MINTLNGLTILRFAHAFRSGGGTEQYLEDIDHILLTRNKAKIIRMYFEKESKDGKITTKDIGQGSLVEIPMHVNVEAMQSNSNKKGNWQLTTSFFKTIFREFIVYNPFLYRIFFRDFLKRYYPRPMGFEIKNAGEKVRKILKEYNVDLLVMHSVGTVDSAEIIDEAKKLRIPFIFINHFSNLSFNNVSIREQISDAACIAGVNGLGVPRRLKSHFYNLSDGIDMKVFNPERVRSVEIDTSIPIIFYPARITKVKGQCDLIKTCYILRSEGLHTRIVFAGRIDSPEYEDELRGLVKKNGLTNDVLFIGQLNKEELRDWYGIASVLAFPTYHQEGLGRILIEAQAMKVPGVAYIIGGTPEGIQHGKTGFLVRKGDIKTFTKRLRELLTNETMRKAMGEEGRRFVQENFSLEALADRHEKYYLRVLSNAKMIGNSTIETLIIQNL